MPIYEQSYRRWEARGPLRRLRAWPITREALRMILARRAFLGLLLLAALPFLFRVGQIFFVTRFPEAARVLSIDGRLFGEFLNGQLLVLLLLSIFGGAGLIANDLRTGAILVYLSRPLTRRDYVLGKLGVLLALNLSATLAPGLLLYAVGGALAPEHIFKWELAWLAPAIVLHSLVLSLSVSLLALAISALSRSARVAGLGFFALMVVSNLVLLIVRRIWDAPWVFVLSVWDDLTSLGDALFGSSTRGETLPWIYPALALAVLAAGCLAVLRSRVRAVEVVR
jgi:ABC-2 type transport system permease protein